MQQSSLIANQSIPAGHSSSQQTEELIVQKIMKATDNTKLITYLCIHRDALIAALNNYERVLLGRLTNDAIILIAGSKLENCRLIAKSSLYLTLDDNTKKTIDILLQNQEQIKSHMARHSQSPPPSKPDLTLSP